MRFLVLVMLALAALTRPGYGMEMAGGREGLSPPALGGFADGGETGPRRPPLRVRFGAWPPAWGLDKPWLGVVVNTRSGLTLSLEQATEATPRGDTQRFRAGITLPF
ncbi:hypothetical protein HHL28_14720 [Aerophototrophica crusticola]|uniref:Uncharacterized protein n=1 Tax=Aerophototrophica crusticola TaxID=1709002 RepID=A0A858R9U3_9PROT|nr:hypothetical protein HHL28_14720 [Rhodospirillaceae bacterium B3]